LPEHFRRCAVHVNLTPAGFGDKVALEAMSCGRPCLFANADFFKMLGDAGRPFYFEPGSVAGLREVLGLVLGWSQERRRQESEPLRQWVESNHSLAGLARRIVGELVELREVNRG
jgi:glycosyltransferase involved in cell wall biosynthesis